MERKIIKLNESQLKKIIKECVKRVLKEKKVIKEGNTHSDLYAYVSGKELIEEVAWNLIPDDVTERQARRQYAQQLIEKWVMSDPAIKKIYKTEYTIWAEGSDEEPGMWSDGGSSFDITNDDGLDDDIKQIKDDKLRELIYEQEEYELNNLNFNNYTEEQQDYVDSEDL